MSWLKQRKIPLRTCIGCQEQKPKKELVRIVRTPEGRVELDPTGKKAGRGTYLCKQKSCLEKAVKAKRIERNLQQAVSPAVVEELAAQLSEDE
ncbi:MAG TPA: YlxR family protein [Oscillospiraceae bacterium]|nr:YlxR family protein [Oscillospiraceae bacterium]